MNKVTARLVLAQNVFAHQHSCDKLSIRVAILVIVGQPVRAHMGRGLC